MTARKAARNDPCPCGSGKKYKKCCAAQEDVAPPLPSSHASIPGTIQAALEHHRAGRLPQAQTLYQQVLELDPNHPAALHLLGKIAYKIGKHEQAVELIRKAITIRPIASMYCDLGAVFKTQEKLEAAAQSYRDALAFKRDDPDAHNNLGAVLYALGRVEEAVNHYRAAIALDPSYVEAQLNLALALKAQGKLGEAISCLRHALALKPDFAEAHNGLGLALQEQGGLEEAITHYRKALALKPGLIETYNNLGLALQEQGKLDEAIRHFRQALQIDPHYDLAQCNLLLAMSFHPEVAPPQYLAAARHYGDSMMARAKPYTAWHTRPAARDLPLRVGLVSGDLRSHPVGYFLESLLEHLNPARVELLAYSSNPQEDALTARIKPRFVAWNLIAGVSDEAAAHKIHEDGIHILIDLAGLLAHNRLPLFARKPAPLQVSWLGYWASSGLPTMDYLLVDRLSAPESQREYFTEKLWYLPDTRLCFTPPVAVTQLEVSPLPALRNGHITFACFQRLFKINDGVLAAWGKIFRALPQARLRLQSKQMSCPVARAQLLRRLSDAGIVAERIVLSEPSGRERYLAAHAEVDIILDTFPYAGGTTTCEALWMGVPTLTLAGDRVIARQGASMMACAGLKEWIADDTDDYVSRALELAADVDGLVQLRAGLRQKVLASPLFDAARFALHLEGALHAMWQEKMGENGRPEGFLGNIAGG